MSIEKFIIDDAIKSFQDFMDSIKIDGENSRYKSWEHCYLEFYKARSKQVKDYDYLSLHLAFYLASWGMYRGSSFLLQRDYKIHIPAVEIILQSDYDLLMGINCNSLEENFNILDKLNDDLVGYYEKIRQKVYGNTKVKEKVSSTLITKILMGTLGCIPAYDRFFISGIKRAKISTGNYNEASLSKLIEFYKENNEKLEQIRNNSQIKSNSLNIKYPQMKILDMIFWNLGYKSDNINSKKTHHKAV